MQVKKSVRYLDTLLFGHAQAQWWSEIHPLKLENLCKPHSKKNKVVWSKINRFPTKYIYLEIHLQAADTGNLQQLQKQDDHQKYNINQYTTIIVFDYLWW